MEQDTAWRSADDTAGADEALSRGRGLLAIENSGFTCRWHFATTDNGRWFDLSNGDEFSATHWMPLPLAPSEIAEQSS